MLKKLTALLVCPLCLTSCQQFTLQGRGVAPNVTASPVASAPVLEPELPRFSTDQGRIMQSYKGLEAWWSFFNDSVLNSLVSSGLSMNAASLSKKVNFPKGNMAKEALEGYYKDKRVDLVNAITKDYIDYRYIQIQNNLLEDYLYLQETALQDAVGRQGKQSRTELEHLRKKKEEFTKKLRDVSVSLSKTTRLLPEYIDEVLKDNQNIPDYDITPIMTSSARIITNAAKIDVSRTMLFNKSRGQINIQETQDVLPDTRLNQLFGISENIFVNANSSWRVKIGHAREQINLGSLYTHSGYRMQIQEFGDSIYAYVSEIEGMLVSIATLRDQQEVLQRAATRAAQKDVYKAKIAALRAEYEKTKAIVELFKDLDLY